MLLHFVIDGGASVNDNAHADADADNNNGADAAAACHTKRTRHCGSAPGTAAPHESFLKQITLLHSLNNAVCHRIALPELVGPMCAMMERGDERAGWNLSGTVTAVAADGARTVIMLML
jgi:hypothetical protein